MAYGDLVFIVVGYRRIYYLGIDFECEFCWLRCWFGRDSRVREFRNNRFL